MALLLWPEVRLEVLWEVCGCEAVDEVDPVDWRTVVAEPEDGRAVALEDWVEVPCRVVDPEAELPLRTLDDAEDEEPEGGVVRVEEAVELPLRTGVVVVRTVVRPLLVTFELETVVSRRSMLVRPDWEEPVVVVLAPEDAARMVVDDEDERAEEEDPLAVFCAKSGAVPERRRMQAAAAEILCNLFIVL